MSDLNGGIPAPNDADAIAALASLENEGETVDDPQPIVEEPKEPKEEPKEPTKEPERIPTMVEAWKLRVVEDQKASVEKQVKDLQAKVEELSKQKSDITPSQKQEIADDIKTIAEESGVDAEFLNKFANSILKKAESSLRSDDKLLATVKDLQAKNELAEQLNLYSEDFDKNVLPLVKGYNLSDETLSKIKAELRDVAFSETYAKVPLAEIFRIKQDSFDLKEAKKSSESKGVKVRDNAGVVDLDSLDTEAFERLSDDQIAALADRKGTGWKVPK